MASRMTARAFVGNEIRRARMTKGLSRANLAKPLMVSESLIAAWESGRQSILPEHMKRLLGFEPDGTLRTPILEFPPEFIVRMVEALVDGETKPEFEDRWLAAEKQATCLWSYEPYLVTGLLQTPEYAHAILPGEESFSRRAKRQKILSDAIQPQLVAVLGESALRYNVGGPDVMIGQLEYLAECAERDNNIIVSIIPADSAICAKFVAPFSVITLRNGKELAYTESSIRGEVIERPEDIVTLKKLFDQYRADALRTEDSVSLIRRVAEQWKS